MHRYADSPRGSAVEVLARVWHSFIYEMPFVVVQIWILKKSNCLTTQGHSHFMMRCPTPPDRWIET